MNTTKSHRKNVRVYPASASEAAFLLGGIGTGNFSIGSRGEWRDWEIFNHSSKKTQLPFAFASIWCCRKGEAPVVRVLESELRPPFAGAHGFNTWEVAGLPRLRDSYISSRYPFVNVDFIDDELPVMVSLEAFTPFIPLNADDSGIPAAVLRYKVKNNGNREVDVSIACSLPNASGYLGPPQGKFDHNIPQLSRQVSNQYVNYDVARGLFYTCEDDKYPLLKLNSMALLTTNKDVSFKTSWIDGSWTDGAQNFWDDFREDGRLEDRPSIKLPDYKTHSPVLKVGSLCAHHVLEPGTSYVFEFVISWYYPIREKDWNEARSWCNAGDCCDVPITRNYYATIFSNALDAGLYLIKNLPQLEKYSRAFSDALYSSTLPDYVIDAVASNITVLRSPTCFRIEDGTFLSWEGCFDLGGCCQGTCTHVWNYAQTVAFLFPELEKSARRVEFGLETDENGYMAYRTEQVFGKPKWDYVPAADGQLGTLIRLYREWKLTGDHEFLQSLWARAKAALQFALDYWDPDHDYLPEGEQHNTYDTDFYGPNPLTCSLLYGALLAMAEMAEFLGETEYAERCRTIFSEGSTRCDRRLWNGEYYIQDLEDVNFRRYQFGNGCLSDQLLGQFMAHIVGLGYVLPEEHVNQALRSIFRYNFKESFRENHFIQRTYALGDEQGLVLCTWPKGGRPLFPFPYSSEVWTGVEYQVAASLIYGGMVDEGLKIVKAVRDRYDGFRRNPWNEVECGHHYVRSMASWGLLTALSGFTFDMARDKVVGFQPKINEDDFSTFFSTGICWGIYTQKRDSSGKLHKKIKILYGDDSVKLSDN